MLRTKIVVIGLIVILAFSNISYAISIIKSPGDQNISPIIAKKMIDHGAVLVDVRSLSEYNSAHIPGAISIPLLEISCGSCLINKLGGHTVSNIIVYGYESKMVSGILAKKGFENVYNLNGGIAAWVNTGFSLVQSFDDSDCGCHDKSVDADEETIIGDNSRFSFSIINKIKNRVTDAKIRVKDELQQIQNAIREKNASWTAGWTSVSDLTDEEKSLLLSGFKIEEKINKDTMIVDENKGNGDEDGGMPPFALDNKHDCRIATYNGITGNWMTSVKDQKSCGSCWAFAIAGCVESMMEIESRNPNLEPNLAEQYLVSNCCPTGSCSGGYIDSTLDFIKNTGIVTKESNCPYKATNTACTCGSYPKTKIKSWSHVSSGVQNVKNALVNHGPLVVGMRVYSDFFYYKSGDYNPIVSEDEKNVTGPNHAIVLVGYNDYKNHWILKNSWGKSWGDNGYFTIRYNSNYVEQYAWWVQADGNTPQRSITVTLPNGNEKWKTGEQYTITWDSTGIIASVNIDLYKGGTKERNIKSLALNDGSYSWNIPPNQATGLNYKIRIASTSNNLISDESNGYFSITNDDNPDPPDPDDPIIVDSPSAGDEWQRGKTHMITWTTNGDIGDTVKIELLKVGIFPTTIDNNVPVSSGSHPWDIPPNQATGLNYKIRITSNSDSLISDESSTFSITNDDNPDPPDPDPPGDILVEIKNIEEGQTHFFGIPMGPSPSGKTILIGRSDIIAEIVKGNATQVDFYLNDKHKATVYSDNVYVYTLKGLLIGKQTIEVIASKDDVVSNIYKIEFTAFILR